VPQRHRTQRGLLETLLREPTYPELLGLDVTREDHWFPWLLAASLFAKPISSRVARKSATLLFQEGVTSPEAVQRCGWDRLVEILDAGGYVRYDFSTADKLLALAEALPGDRLPRLVRSASSRKDFEAELLKIRGVGPKTVEIFLRELRSIVRFPVPLSEEARAAARRLSLRLDATARSPKRLARIEGVLARIWIEHCKAKRWSACPAGPFCGCRPRKSLRRRA